MQIFFTILSVLVGLFYSPKPSAASDGRNAAVDSRANQDKITGGSSGTATVEPGLGASLLSWSYKFFDGPKSTVSTTDQPVFYPTHIAWADAYIGALESFTRPNKWSTPDFWEEAKKMEQTLLVYVPRLLKEAEKFFKSTAITDIPRAVENILLATATFRSSIQDALDARHITFDALTQELEVVFTGIARKLENITHTEKAPGHAERSEMVNKVLDDTALALLDFATRYGIKEDIVTTYMGALRPHVHALIVAVGNINEQHPELLSTLMFSVATLLIPEQWILRPFLSVLGFGPAGPMKGSAAAWMQRFFWGAEVKAGSWFSLLQAAGMGVTPKWVGTVVKPLAIRGMLAPFFRYFYRR